MSNIAIFASGSGTNAENLIQYFSGNKLVTVKLVLSNKADAYVHERAKLHQIASVSFNRDQFYNTDYVLRLLADNQIDIIILAGFLWLVPNSLIQAYPNKIINIHPALLPKYGGKGMYGMKVHEAIIKNGEKESGITIHFVNDKYDDGEIIAQVKCKIEPDETPESLANKIHLLEYEHFPKVIERWIKKLS
ncbi:MAG: phosphoribosylglycinamide formyltransferase [Bacteroidales bacterium]|nr:phosphoribosylglycinamide formyltransferase [Bacteroidales bacterium]